MSHTIRLSNGFLTMCDTDFNCPKCNHKHTEDFWYDRLCKSKNGVIYKKCKGCKTLIGITTDMKGDVRVWLKEREKFWGKD